MYGLTIKHGSFIRVVKQLYSGDDHRNSIPVARHPQDFVWDDLMI